MSKSKGNVEGPDELVDAFGADAVRLSILFMGPADQDMEWTDSGDRRHEPLHPPTLADRRARPPEQAPTGEAGDGSLVRKAHATVCARH